MTVNLIWRHIWPFSVLKLLSYNFFGIPSRSSALWIDHSHCLSSLPWYPISCFSLSLIFFLKVNEVQLLKCQAVAGSFALYYKWGHMLMHLMRSQLLLMGASLSLEYSIKMHRKICSFSYTELLTSWLTMTFLFSHQKRCVLTVHQLQRWSSYRHICPSRHPRHNWYHGGLLSLYRIVSYRIVSYRIVSYRIVSSSPAKDLSCP